MKDLKVFSFGLSVRLIGVALIWLGDGSASLFRKSLVVLGVVLLIGGTGVLRYMLLSPLLSKLTRRSGASLKPLDLDRPTRSPS